METKLNIDSKSSPRRRGSTGSDVSDNERELAQSALIEFNKRNFSASLHLLNKLLTTRSKDIKVLSNKSVIEYFQSELKSTDTFQKTLVDICIQSGVKIDKISTTDEVDASVIRLNQCSVLFHLRQYRAAVSLLEDMYNGLESLEESVSIGLCLLLAECFLGLSLPGRALSVVAHTEATFLPQPLPPQKTSKVNTDTLSKSPDKGAGSHEDTESPLSSRTNILNIHTTTDCIGGSSELRCSADQEVLRGRLHLLRVRCLLMMRVMRVAKKEVKAVVTHAVNSGSQLNVTLIMLKSQLEYLRGSLRKSVKVLNQCAAIPAPGPSFGPKLSIAYYNNLGVIHVGLGKPTLACFYLQKALHELKDVEDKEDLSTLYSNSCRVETDLCHNLGITLLHMNKPSQAFDFLIQVVKVYSTNARLWLRICECCIAVHKINLESDSHPDSFKKCTKTIGSGAHRKVCVINNSNSHDKKLSDQQHTTDSALPVPTLEFARLCLRNALALMPDNISTTHLTDEQEASGVLPELHPCSPSPPMKGPQLMNIKLTCLMCSAYVCLCLGDYLMSLQHSQALVALIPKVLQGDGGMFKIFGHLYAGESLIHLDRVSEAINHFDPRLVGDLNLFQKEQLPDESNMEQTHNGLFPNDRLSSQRLLRYNLCVTYALMGYFDKAGILINEIMKEKNGESSAQIVMLSLYVNLKLGKSDVAKSLLQTHIPPS